MRWKGFVGILALAGVVGYGAFNAGVEYENQRQARKLLRNFQGR